MNYLYTIRLPVNNEHCHQTCFRRKLFFCVNILVCNLIYGWREIRLVDVIVVVQEASLGAVGSLWSLSEVQGRS